LATGTGSWNGPGPWGPGGIRLGLENVSREDEAEAGLDDLGQDVTLAEDLHLAAIDLDVGTTELAEEHFVTDDDAHRSTFTTLEQPAGTDGDHGASLRLFLGRVGQHDATRGGFLGTKRLDNNSIVQRIQLHLYFTPGCLVPGHFPDNFNVD